MKALGRLQKFTLEGRAPKVKEQCVNVPVILKPCASRISIIRNAAATNHQRHPDVLKETPILCLPNAALPRLIIFFIIVPFFSQPSEVQYNYLSYLSEIIVSTSSLKKFCSAPKNLIYYHFSINIFSQNNEQNISAVFP